MKINSNLKIVKENGQKSTSINFKHYKMNFSMSLRNLTNYMIIFIKPMKLQNMKKLNPINQSYMSRMNSFMKNKSCNQNRKSYRSS